jgi:hypothetical protein
MMRHVHKYTTAITQGKETKNPVKHQRQVCCSLQLARPQAKGLRRRCRGRQQRYKSERFAAGPAEQFAAQGRTVGAKGIEDGIDVEHGIVRELISAEVDGGRSVMATIMHAIVHTIVAIIMHAIVHTIVAIIMHAIVHTIVAIIEHAIVLQSCLPVAPCWHPAVTPR